jgi:tRNA threonylcarbamoyladenosine biosynthesis protein TsaB
MTNIRILALDSSIGRGSVAAAADGRTLDSICLPLDKNTTTSLAPAIDSLLRRVGWKPPEVGLVAVAVGPGSFTGLRIAVTAAKTFAYAVGAKILGISTLEAIAQAAPDNVDRVHVVLDAQRGDLYTGFCQRRPDGAMALLAAPTLRKASDWLDGLRPDDCVTGPALAKLAALLPRGVVALSPERWVPTAAAVGEIAWRDWQAGRRDDHLKLVPLYLRKSAAEEKAERTSTQ